MRYCPHGAPADLCLPCNDPTGEPVDGPALLAARLLAISFNAPPALEPAVCSHYILRAYSHPGDWLQPGGFFETLIEAAQKADPGNLNRITRGFPVLGSLLAIYKAHGPAPVLEIAQQLTP